MNSDSPTLERLVGALSGAYLDACGVAAAHGHKGALLLDQITAALALARMMANADEKGRGD